MVEPRHLLRAQVCRVPLSRERQPEQHQLDRDLDLSQSSRRRSSPVSSPIRRSRWRSVFGCTYSASAVALMLPRRRRNSSSVRRSAVAAARRRRRAERPPRPSSPGRRASSAIRSRYLYGAELVVGHDARLPAEHGRAGERVARLLEAVGEGWRARQTLDRPIATGARAAAWMRTHRLGHRVHAATRHGHERPDRVVAAVERAFPAARRRERPARGARRAGSASRTSAARRGRSRAVRRGPRVAAPAGPARAGRRSP